MDQMLTHWGDLGWELATIVHAPKIVKDEIVNDENILTPEAWMLVFKQPVS